MAYRYLYATVPTGMQYAMEETLHPAILFPGFFRLARTPKSPTMLLLSIRLAQRVRNLKVNFPKSPYVAKSSECPVRFCVGVHLDSALINHVDHFRVVCYPIGNCKWWTMASGYLVYLFHALY
jgi:hypothetical protein